MLNNSRKILAIALAALFLSTPLMSTASAAAPDFSSPTQLELRSKHHNPPPPSRGPSHSMRHDGHRGPSHMERHAPGPRYASHDRGRHNGHHKPAPPPRHDKHHHHSSSNDKFIGDLIAGAVIGAVIANNT